MQSNKLQLNWYKTEVLWFTTGRRQHPLPTTALSIGVSVSLVTSVRNLGIFINFDLVMRTRVQRTVSGCIAVDSVQAVDLFNALRLKIMFFWRGFSNNHLVLLYLYLYRASSNLFYLEFARASERKKVTPTNLRDFSLDKRQYATSERTRRAIVVTLMFFCRHLIFILRWLICHFRLRCRI